MNDFFNTNPKVTTALFALIGYILTDDLTAAEQNVLGNWLMLTAQTIITNSSSQGLIENRVRGNIINLNSEKIKREYNPFSYDIQTLRNLINSSNKDNINNIIDRLTKKINNIEEALNELKN